MAEKSFHLEIVTPKRTVFSADVESFSAPGVVGGFQVLKSHAPLLSSIRVGEVKIIGVDEKELRFATSGGFVEVHHNKVVMLAETAERSDEIDIERAKQAKERAQRRLAERRLEIDLERARFSLLRSINRMKIAAKN